MKKSKKILTKSEEMELLTLTAQRVDAQSNVLIKEFYDHMHDCLEENPGDTATQDQIFQGWMIQKIALLQLSICDLLDMIHGFKDQAKFSKDDTDSDMPF